MNSCYVYFLVNPCRPGKFQYPGLDISFLFEPYYCGKGTGYRMHHHFHLSEKGTSPKDVLIQNIIAEGYSPKKFCIKYKVGLNNEDANNLERSAINSVGMYSKGIGPLLNKIAGGSGNGNGRLKSSPMPLEEQNTLCSLYLEGKNMIELSKLFNKSLTYITKILRENSIDVRPSIATRKLNDNEELLLCADYKSGITPAVLSTKYKVSKRSVQTILERNGVPRHKRVLLPIELESTVISRYLEGESSVKIADSLGVCGSVVLRILRINNIHRRSRKDYANK